jgi:hypothetical protein
LEGFHGRRVLLGSDPILSELAIQTTAAFITEKRRKLQMDFLLLVGGLERFEV